MSRDRTVGDTFFIAFTTRAFATGIPTVLAGTPVVSAYEDASTTQITAGITLGVSHDGVVGLNMLTLVATGGNGYESGKDYNLVITTGTVGGVSVVGEVVGQFSLNLSAAAVDLANGTDGLGAIKGDTAEIGTAGAGLTNINLPDQTMDITGNLSGSVGSVTGAVGSVTGAVGSVTGSVGSVAGNVDGSTASVTGAVGSVTGAVGSVTGSVGSVAGNVDGSTASVTGAVGSVTGAVGSVTGAVGSVAGNVDGNVTGSVGSVVGDTAQTGDNFARLGAPAGASVSADIAALEADAIQKNAAYSNFEFLMVLTSDHVTPATGLTVTGERSIDGGAFSAVSGTIAEVSNGIYQFDALAADTNGDVITWRFLSATADDTFVTFNTST